MSADRQATWVVVLSLFALLLLPASVSGQPASSTSFRLTAQTLNTGGGQSTSASFAARDCLLLGLEAGGTLSNGLCRTAAVERPLDSQGQNTVEARRHLR
jgi:hypothetical protein